MNLRSWNKAVLACAASAVLAIMVDPLMVARAQTASPAKVTKKTTQNKVAIQVTQNDKAAMDLALNNASNVVEYFKSKGESVTVEIVTFGPGLHMLREDTSPVKARVAAMSLQHSNIRFAACGNTQANMSKSEGKPIPLVSEAKITPSGVVRLMELQGQGYAYIRP